PASLLISLSSIILLTVSTIFSYHRLAITTTKHPPPPPMRIMLHQTVCLFLPNTTTSDTVDSKPHKSCQKVQGRA
ncbi:hypothetical protein A2U01_0041761, partial [Trifolium medium]|nr:hypothetical protein [Trifolium medium]